MKARLLSLGMVLALAACSEAAKPDPTSGHGGSNETGVSSSTSGSGGSASSDQGDYADGTRLKVRTLKGADGSAQQLGFYDSMLKQNCVFETADDGTQRCMPITAIVAGIYFYDANCSVPLVVSSCALPTSTLVRQSNLLNPSCVANQGGTIVSQLGPTHTGPIFTGSPAACVQAGDTADAPFSLDSVYRVGTQIPTDSFVKGTETVQ